MKQWRRGKCVQVGGVQWRFYAFGAADSHRARRCIGEAPSGILELTRERTSKGMGKGEGYHNQVTSERRGYEARRQEAR